MRMVICGMGEVGRHLAAELAEGGQDVVAVDRSHGALSDVEAGMDVLTLHGHAALPDTLRQAGASRAELVAAVTDNDEVNLVTALAARHQGASFTVARVNNRDYFPDRTGWVEDLFGVDLALCPGLLAGAEVVRLTRAGTVDYVEDFAGHLIQVMVVSVDEDVPAAGRAAAQLALPTGCRVLAVIRDEESQTPESVPHLQPEDRVVISGPAQTLYQLDRLFRGEGRRRGRALVVGGGDVGTNIATELLKIMDSVILADRDPERCARLAESSAMSGVQIARGEGTSMPFLQELDVSHARAFVATTRADEVNLMGTLLSKQLGAERAIALLHRPDYADVYRALGIDWTVSPRLLVSREILHFLRRRREAVQATIPIDNSVIMELQVQKRSRLRGKRLFDMDLPHGVVPAAVARGRQLLEEPELVELQAGDVVVVYAPERAVAGARRALLRR
ncbi:MAG: Trk system potassium transporter TrkA [Myxococcota bacterium]